MNDNNDNKKKPKIPKIYKCEKCKYITLNKKDYNKHLATLKHLKVINKSPKIPTPFICSECGKTYKFLSGLSRHHKTCISKKFLKIFRKTKKFRKFTKLLSKFFKILTIKILILKPHLFNFLIKLPNFKILSSNNKTNITKKSVVFYPKSAIIIIINSILTSSSMKNAKDAINIMDFVQSLQHQIKDLENTGKLGYVDGITNVFLRGLKELDINKRPIHCSDIKKEILYVKDNDQWGKDNDEIKMKKAIDFVSKSHIKQIPDWVEENNNESDNNETYYQILKEAVNYNDENVSQIIKNISKNVIIENDTKNNND